jgi:hypothetical protein
VDTVGGNIVTAQPDTGLLGVLAQAKGNALRALTTNKAAAAPSASAEQARTSAVATTHVPGALSGIAAVASWGLRPRYVATVWMRTAMGAPTKVVAVIRLHRVRAIRLR